VLAQTYRDFEIVVIDDGSTDDSAEIIMGYASDPRVRLIRQANGGQARAKNVGVRMSNGEFIAFLDADDLWEPTKLQHQLPLFDDLTVGVVFSRSRYVDADGRHVWMKPSSKYLRPRRGRVTNYLFFDNFVPFSSSVVRRTILGETPPFDESLAMGIDWGLWLRLSTECRFDYVDRPLVRYRIGHEGQMSKNLLVRQQCSQRIMEAFLEAHPNVLTASEQKDAWTYTQRNRALFYLHRDDDQAELYFRKVLARRPADWVSRKELLKMRIRRLFSRKRELS
jgi:glycosyltransferase involved in cell wall biosynthesis